MALTLTGGVKALRKIQIGLESTPGTAVAATTIWRGIGLMQDQRVIQHVDEEVGIAMPTTRNYTPKLGVVCTFDPIEMTYQQIPYLLEAGVAAETPTQDGAGSDYIYAYAFPGTALVPLNTYTLEGGNNQQAYEMDYAHVASFNLAGNAAEGAMMNAEWVGRTMIDTTFTGALAIPTLLPGHHLKFGDVSLYIDEPAGTIGSTQISNTLYNFNLEVVTGYVPVWTDESTEFDYVQWVRAVFSAKLTMTYKHHTTADAEQDKFEGNTARLVRLEFTGPAFQTPGTTYSNYTFQINAAGVYTEYTHAEQDGNDTKVGVLQIGHDLTASQGLDFLVVNESVTLP